MNKIVLSLFLVLQVCNVNAQYNLVPNPSFEQYSICPNGYGQINHAVGWNIPLLFSTADYFDSCNATGYVDVPQNFYGFEPAHTGGAYVGVLTYQIVNMQQRNYREFVQTELSDSLVAGVEYCVRWYVSACDSCKYTSNNFGIYFSPVQINDTCIPNYCNLNLIPQIENSPFNNLNSRNGWTEIFGSFIASGSEKFIIIGNFRDTLNTTASYTGWGDSSIYSAAFYYMDDVLVTPCDSLTGISQNEFNSEINIYPNPFKSTFYIHSGNKIESILIYDVEGREIYSGKNNLGVYKEVSLDNLSQGIYLIKVNTIKSHKYLKLIKH